MILSKLLPATALAAALLAQPALAQTDAARPAVGTATPDTPPAANTASVASPSGTLGVASVKLDRGWRASKLIGSTVYNEQNEKIGSVDDLIVTPSDKVVMAVISVGGFLGIGSKLVAVPYDQIHVDNGHVSIIGADKNTLTALPSFTYENT
jgi:sporulation protein YlmC with PRC-barrel domain